MLLGYVLRALRFELRSTRRVRLSDCVDDDDTVLSKLVRRIIVRFLRARLQPWFISTLYRRQTNFSKICSDCVRCAMLCEFYLI